MKCKNCKADIQESDGYMSVKYPDTSTADYCFKVSCVNVGVEAVEIHARRIAAGIKEQK